MLTRPSLGSLPTVAGLGDGPVWPATGNRLQPQIQMYPAGVQREHEFLTLEKFHRVSFVMFESGKRKVAQRIRISAAEPPKCCLIR
jgi:hypothetical protein